MAVIHSFVTGFEALADRAAEEFDSSVLHLGDFAEGLQWTTRPEAIIGYLALQLGVVEPNQVTDLETYVGLIRDNLGETSTITLNHPEGATSKLFVALDALDTAIDTNVSTQERWKLYYLQRRTRGLAAAIINGVLSSDEDPTTASREVLPGTA